MLVVPNLSNIIKVPKYTNILWDANSTPNFKADISKANVFSKLNPDISANPNENYDILEKIFVHNINKHSLENKLNLINTSIKRTHGLQKAYYTLLNSEITCTES